MTRRLTPSALRRLNELIASGVPYGDAISQVHDYEQVRARAPAPPPSPPATLARAIAAIDASLEELLDLGVLVGSDAGCSAEEIAALESDTGRALPRAYLHFLSRVGKERTRLISHDHIAAELHRLRSMQARGEDFMRRHDLPLPPDAFFLMSRLGDCHHYVVCEGRGAIEACVWVAREDLDAPFMAHASIAAMVRSLADDALRAWRSGYFVDRPDGTRA